VNAPKPPRPSSVVTDLPADGPPAPVAPARAPFGAAATDPQAGIETKEHDLADLREAARLARLHAAPPDEPVEPVERDEPGDGEIVDLVDPTDAANVEVDLVEAERAESAALEPDALDAAGEGDDATGLSPIDPRIRDRRVAVTRAEGRRRLRILLAAIAVASAIGIVWLVIQSPFLALKTINVEGAAAQSAAEVQAAAAVEEGTALLFLDTGAVERRVEALAWVGDARVERELPTSLTITVNERLPVAWVRRPVPPGSPEGSLGSIVIVDRSGRVLGDEAQPPVGLPELIGVTRVPDRGDRIVPAAPARAVAELPDALRSQTATLHRRGGQAVLGLAAPPGGAEPAAGEVKLGNFEAIGAKGAAALAVLDQLFRDRDEVGYIDVRVPGAPATGD
jgi:cell division protein FtsQ